MYNSGNFYVFKNMPRKHKHLLAAMLPQLIAGEICKSIHCDSRTHQTQNSSFNLHKGYCENYSTTTSIFAAKYSAVLARRARHSLDFGTKHMLIQHVWINLYHMVWQTLPLLITLLKGCFNEPNDADSWNNCILSQPDFVLLHFLFCSDGCQWLLAECQLK